MGTRGRQGARPPRGNRRKTDWLGAARSAALVFLVVELLHVAFASPRLTVRTVRVTGAVQASEERIRRLAEVQPGANIFQVNLHRAKKGIMREPLVRDATVTRVLPDAILISVRERTARMLATCGGRAWEVDDSGLPFREREPGEGAADEAELPELELPPGQPPVPGEPLPRQRWEAALACHEGAAAYRLPLRKIIFDAHGELWLNIAVPTAAGRDERLLPVRLARPENLRAKFAQLRWVIGTAIEDGEYLDLMCAGRAAYRKRGGALLGAVMRGYPRSGSTRGGQQRDVPGADVGRVPGAVQVITRAGDRPAAGASARTATDEQDGSAQASDGSPAGKSPPAPSGDGGDGPAQPADRAAAGRGLNGVRSVSPRGQAPVLGPLRPLVAPAGGDREGSGAVERATDGAAR